MQIIVNNNSRVDKYLAISLPQYSRASLTKLFDLSLVLLDGKIVRPGHKVKSGQSIEVDISPLNKEQEVVELPIVYEDDNVLVVNKPSGIISHARGRYWYEPSVASFLRYHVLKNKLTIENQENDRAGIVHRLDRATSGVMVCAKNEQTTKYLQKQFSDRKVLKNYIAVLEGVPNDKQAIIDAPIERNPKKPSTFRVGANGKASQTQYKVLQTSDKRSLVEFIPRTGRTHQLRVHAVYIDCPIVGDVLYGKEADRLYLHANSITLDIPEFGKKTFTAELPEDFKNAI